MSENIYVEEEDEEDFGPLKGKVFVTPQDMIQAIENHDCGNPHWKSEDCILLKRIGFGCECGERFLTSVTAVKLAGSKMRERFGTAQKRNEAANQFNGWFGHEAADLPSRISQLDR